MSPPYSSEIEDASELEAEADDSELYNPGAVFSTPKAGETPMPKTEEHLRRVRAVKVVQRMFRLREALFEYYGPSLFSMSSGLKAAHGKVRT